LVQLLTGTALTECRGGGADRDRRRRGKSGGFAERLNQIAKGCTALPDLDPRRPDEIIGYDEFGVPLMVIDAPAILAILFDEPERHTMIVADQ
jgi:hypothetical protein